MDNKQKLEKLVKLFDEIKTLFPDNNVSMNVHSIDFKDLPESTDWKIKPLHAIFKTPVLVATRRDQSQLFDITLFQDSVPPIK
jgi:hypothetical protein